jgi:hypothetical protein
MTLIIQKPTGGKLNLRKTWQPMDPDAAAYITAVETADTEPLEERTKIAIDNFVLGCKADGIWSAIKASCILAGARTLSGALVPLVGPAPTNPGSVFLSDDYNRKTGLLGDGSTKYLDTNIANNAAGSQNDIHGSVYVTVNTSAANQGFFGADSTRFFLRRASSSTNLTTRINQSTDNTTSLLDGQATGFFGAFRGTTSQAIVRAGKREEVISRNSATGDSASILVFARVVSAAPAAFLSSRLAFYSMGESLDLALLDARVTDLINAFAAAIP